MDNIRDSDLREKLLLQQREYLKYEERNCLECEAKFAEILEKLKKIDEEALRKIDELRQQKKYISNPFELTGLRKTFIKRLTDQDFNFLFLNLPWRQKLLSDISKKHEKELVEVQWLRDRAREQLEIKKLFKIALYGFGLYVILVSSLLTINWIMK